MSCYWQKHGGLEQQFAFLCKFYTKDLFSNIAKLTFKFNFSRSYAVFKYNYGKIHLYIIITINNIYYLFYYIWYIT